MIVVSLVFVTHGRSEHLVASRPFMAHGVAESEDETLAEE